MTRLTAVYAGVVSSTMTCLSPFTAYAQIDRQQLQEVMRSHVTTIDGRDHPEDVSIVKTVGIFLERYADNNDGWSEADWSTIQTYSAADRELRERNDEAFKQGLSLACDTYVRNTTQTESTALGYASDVSALIQQLESKQRVLYERFLRSLSNEGQSRLNQILSIDIAPSIRAADVDIVGLTSDLPNVMKRQFVDVCARGTVPPPPPMRSRDESGSLAEAE